MIAKERAASDHWAFTPPQRHEAPAVRDAQWPSRPHDTFVLQRIEEAQLEPNPVADPRTLLRRLSFDLTGLPPNPDEVTAFDKAFRENPDTSLAGHGSGSTSPATPRTKPISWATTANFSIPTRGSIGIG